MTVQTTRRGFLAGGSGLMLALTLPLGQGRAQMTVSGPFAPNAFVRIGTDDLVTVMIKHLEMGQGPYTGLATLVAEELDADWSQMRAEGAPADDTLYANLAFGAQGTGGSTAIANSFMQMRKAGAAARAGVAVVAVGRGHQERIGGVHAPTVADWPLFHGSPGRTRRAERAAGAHRAGAADHHHSMRVMPP